jgi:hypothetical protein
MFNIKIQITRLKPRCTLWWYYFQITGELIVFIEKFLIVKCWICLPSPPIKNLHKFFFTYKPVTPFRKRSHSAAYLILLQLHKHTQIIMIMFSLLHRREDHMYHFFLQTDTMQAEVYLMLNSIQMRNFVDVSY